ncbi:coiled-coil domain-containing protein 33-like [Watersipora subatra]|uniref:coiled-coil domain-containing protein 33-like n=1 Tax=Watersipora subatra TaxID=2589382 RepID=UPI00355B2C6F
MATLYYAPFQRDESGELPAPDAIENVLPDYKYIFYDPNRKTKAKAKEQKTLEEEENQQPTSATAVKPDAHKKAANQSLEQTQMNLLDHQMKELDNYRQAVHKMGKDILTLRDHIHELEDENSSLRRQLNRYDETRKELTATTAADFDAIDKNELIVRYMTLKQRVQSQSTENTELKERIKKLQNELKKRNEKEKGMNDMKKAHTSQSQELHKLQERARKVTQLEKACLQQEKVIENMEKVLNSKKFSGDDATKAINEENQRLRNELEQNKVSGTSEAERLQLYEQLERAENRVGTLEKTLADNARSWAKERQDLQTRLNEAEHGFARTSTMVLHDYPSGPYQRPYEPKQGRTFGNGSPILEPIKRF